MVLVVQTGRFIQIPPGRSSPVRTRPGSDEARTSSVLACRMRAARRMRIARSAASVCILYHQGTRTAERILTCRVKSGTPSILKSTHLPSLTRHILYPELPHLPSQSSPVACGEGAARRPGEAQPPPTPHPQSRDESSAAGVSMSYIQS